jgi:hypothetical protein
MTDRPKQIHLAAHFRGVDNTTGLDELADTVIPLLQERGVLRAEYKGATLRENLGLPSTTPRDRAGAESSLA